jgi:hypothetical protein
MCADCPGLHEALGLIDGCPIGQGNDHANSGCGHKPPANGIMADRVEKHFVEDGKLLPHDPPDSEQWLDDQHEPGRASDQLADPRFELARTHHTDLARGFLRGVEGGADLGLVAFAFGDVGVAARSSFSMNHKTGCSD